MTFKDLQKVIQSQAGPEQSQVLLRLKVKPFWYFDQNRHKEKDRSGKGNCCFNHIIGLPKKNGIEKPLFDYEGILYKALLVPGYLNNNPSSNTLGKDFPNIKYQFKVKHLSDSGSDCGFSHKDEMPLLPGDLYEFPTVDWWWRCPKCKSDFVPSITEQDTVYDKERTYHYL
jgi:hypothetical protein